MVDWLVFVIWVHGRSVARDVVLLRDIDLRAFEAFHVGGIHEKQVGSFEDGWDYQVHFVFSELAEFFVVAEPWEERASYEVSRYK